MRPQDALYWGAAPANKTPTWAQFRPACLQLRPGWGPTCCNLPQVEPFSEQLLAVAKRVFAGISQVLACSATFPMLCLHRVLQRCTTALKHFWTFSWLFRKRTLIVRALLGVEQCKNCMPLWREAHFEVKRVKQLGYGTPLEVEMLKNAGGFGPKHILK